MLGRIQGRAVIPSPRQKKRGFTLVELLVVIGIIALLISILIPALGKAREQAKITKCLVNLRSMSTALQMYAGANRNFVCAVNWGDSPTFNGKVDAGWLYRAGQGLFPFASNLTALQVEDGALWPYLKTHEVYRCPGHDPENIFGRTDSRTSYLMNGSMNSFNFQPSGATAPGKVYPINKFKSDSVCFWEADERPVGSSPFNDGSSYPHESFNPTSTGAVGYASRHGRFSTIAFIDGHAEIISHAEIVTLAQDPGRNILWCAPAEDRPSGH